MDIRRFGTTSRKRSLNATEKGEASSQPAPKSQALHTSDSDHQATCAPAPKGKDTIKAEKRSSTNPVLDARKNGNIPIRGCTALILQTVCSVVCVKHMENHLQQPEVLGPQGELLIGIMPLSC